MEENASMAGMSRAGRLVFGLVVLGQFVFVIAAGHSANLHKVSDLLLLLAAAGGLMSGAIRLRPLEKRICAVFFCVIFSVSVVQFYALGDAKVLLNGAKLLINTAAAFYIAVRAGFRGFGRILRIGMLANTVFILFALLFGSYAYDPQIQSAYSSGFFVNWGPFSMLVIGGTDFFGLVTVRLGGLFGHPNLYGMLAATAMIAMAYEKGMTRRRKAFWWLIFALSFFFSASRACVLFVLVFYLVRRFLRPQPTALSRAESLALLLGALLIGISLLVLRDPEDVTTGRLRLWSIALNECLQQLQTGQYFGVGLEMSSSYLFGLFGMSIPVDNSYLLPLLEMGLPCFGLWLAAVLACWGMAIRQSGAPLRVCLPMLVGLLCYSVFENVLSLNIQSLPWLVYLFALAAGEPCLTGASASGEEDDG